MISTKIVLQKKSTNKDGKHPLKLCFNFKKKQVFINLKIAVSEKDFNNGTIKGTEKHFNNIISAKKLQIDGLLQNLELKGELNKFTPETLKKFIENGGNKVIDDNLLFKTFVIKYIDKYDNRSTRETYNGMLRKVGEFADLQTLTFADLTLAWIKDFDIFMTKGGLATNTRGIYMRNIRTLFNDAIDRELLPLEAYPFRRFKIKKTETAHRNMSIDDLRTLINTPLSKERSRYRDLFMLSFYLCGLNMKDILYLTRDNLRGDMLFVLRSKTDIPIQIKVEPEAKEIIEKYAGKDYLLNPMDTNKDFINFEHKINKFLKMIFPYLSIYWARHTWATIAAELDVPDSIIDLAMGHKLQGMSAIYINRNRNKVFEANRKVIDYVLV